jgi:hypothetical protein
MKIEPQRTWTIAEAEACLCEILRLASEEGPQRIGGHTPFIIVPEGVWNKLVKPRPPLGRWLFENMQVGVDLELPKRREEDRRLNFKNEVAKDKWG